MLASILVCLGSFFLLLWLLQRRMTLGLPVAYLYLLLLIHVPGAIVHEFGWEGLDYRSETESGIYFTAIGAVAFVVGTAVGMSRRQQRRTLETQGFPEMKRWLVGGWAITFFAVPIISRIPSLGAIVQKFGMMWILPVMIGLRQSGEVKNWRSFGRWIIALLVFPVVVLLTGGFLSFGVNATIICSGFLLMGGGSYLRKVILTCFVSLVGMGVFASYFSVRDSIRDAVWGGQDMPVRMSESLRILSEFKPFDLNDPEQADAINQRLNQNVFVGMAAERLDAGVVDYYYGRTVWESVLALVPRALWPSKPVYGGSPGTIRDMCGFTVNDSTSWGVGNVMEFYINFGMWSLLGGFAFLGWLLAWCDRRAMAGLVRRSYADTLAFGLVGVSLIHPGKSCVEMFGGAGAACVGVWCWNRMFAARGPRMGSMRGQSAGPVKVVSEMRH
jgi:hypothetical protein